MEACEGTLALFGLLLMLTRCAAIFSGQLIIPLRGSNSFIQLNITSGTSRTCLLNYTRLTITSMDEVKKIAEDMATTIASDRGQGNNHSVMKKVVPSQELSAKYSYRCIVYNNATGQTGITKLKHYGTSQTYWKEDCGNESVRHPLEITNHGIKVDTEYKDGSAWLPAKWVFIWINNSTVQGMTHQGNTQPDNCLVYDFEKRMATTTYCAEGIELDGLACTTRPSDMSANMLKPSKDCPDHSKRTLLGLSNVHLGLIIGLASLGFQFLVAVGCLIHCCRNSDWCRKENERSRSRSPSPVKTSDAARNIRLHSMQSDFPSSNYDHMSTHPLSHSTQSLTHIGDPHFYNQVGQGGVGSGLTSPKRGPPVQQPEANEYAEPYTHFLSTCAQAPLHIISKPDEVMQHRKLPSPTTAPPKVPSPPSSLIEGSEDMSGEDQYAELSELNPVFPDCDDNKCDPRYGGTPGGKPTAVPRHNAMPLSRPSPQSSTRP